MNSNNLIDLAALAFLCFGVWMHFKPLPKTELPSDKLYDKQVSFMNYFWSLVSLIYLLVRLYTWYKGDPFKVW